MSWVAVDRVMARRLPSRDHANDPMGRFVGEARELARSAAAERLHPHISVAARTPRRARLASRRAAASNSRGADRARRRASGQTADDERRTSVRRLRREGDRSAIRRDGHAGAVGQLRRRAPSNRHHPDRHGPPGERAVEHGPIVGRDHHRRGGDGGHQLGDPATAGIRGPEIEAASLDDETNTIVRPSLVTPGVRASAMTSSGVPSPGVTRRIAGRPPTNPA